MSKTSGYIVTGIPPDKVAAADKAKEDKATPPRLRRTIAYGPMQVAAAADAAAAIAQRAGWADVRIEERGS